MYIVKYCKISLVICLVSLLTFCHKNKQDNSNAINHDFHVIFAPKEGKLDLVNDLRLGDRFSPDVDVDTPDSRSVTLNDLTSSITLADLDGFSTSAQFDISFTKEIDPNSVHYRGKQQNIFLIPLKNNNNNELDNIALANFSLNNHKIIDEKKLAQQEFRANVITLEGQKNTLRISPLVPLAANTKYLVILLNTVKSIDNKSLSLNDEYQFAEEQNDNDSIHKVITQWQRLAKHVIESLNSNQKNSTIAYAYTFTTTRAPLDLIALASPKAALVDAGLSEIEAQKRLEAVNLHNEDVFPQARATQVIEHNIGIADLFHPFMQEFSSIINGVDTDAIANLLHISNDEVQAKIDAINKGLSSFSQSSSLIDQGLSMAANVKFAQGYIRLPYFLAVPKKDAEGNLKLSDIDKDKWSDSKINTSILSPYPINNNKKLTLQKVPFFITYPTSKECGQSNNGKKWPIVIFQHGIFGDRSNSFAAGIALASLYQDKRPNDKCFATIAMDLPLHGISPQLNLGLVSVPSPFIGFGLLAYKKSLEQKIANEKNETIKGQLQQKLINVADLNERHFNLTRNDDGVIVPMSWDLNAGLQGNSGSMYMNFYNLLSQRDRMRQTISDLLNLNASLKSIDIDGDGTTDFDPNQVYFIGHSLGGVLGMPFVAINNDPNVQKFNQHLPKIQAAALLTTGGGLPKLIENSPTFRPTIKREFDKMNMFFGSTDLEHYFYTMQAVTDGTDPINFAALLKSNNTPLYMAEIAGGAPLMDGHGNQVYSDEGKPQFLPADQTIPNSADNQPTAPYKNSIPAPLAGTEPMIRLLGLKGIFPYHGDNAQKFTVTVDDSAKKDQTLRVVSRFNMGSHISPVVGLENPFRLMNENKNYVSYFAKHIDGKLAALLYGNELLTYKYLANDSIERSAGLFIEMMGEVVDLFSNKQSITVNNPSLLSPLDPNKHQSQLNITHVKELTSKKCTNQVPCIIDNDDDAFNQSGHNWKFKEDKPSSMYGKNYAYTSNYSDTGSWWFTINHPGTYKVSISSPSHYLSDASTGVLYNVYSALGESKNYSFNLRKMDKTDSPFSYPTLPNGQFFSLGEFVFNDPQQTYHITIKNRGTKGNLVADVVKIEYISDNTNMSALAMDISHQKSINDEFRLRVQNQINHLKNEINSSTDGHYSEEVELSTFVQLGYIQQQINRQWLTENEIAKFQQQTNDIIEKLKNSFVSDICYKLQFGCVNSASVGKLMSFSSPNYFELPHGNSGIIKSADAAHKKYGQIGKSYRYYTDPNTQVGWTFAVPKAGKYKISVNLPGGFSKSDGYGSAKTNVSLLDANHKNINMITKDTYYFSYALDKTVLFDGDLHANKAYIVQISGAYTELGWLSNTTYGIAADTIKIEYQE